MTVAKLIKPAKKEEVSKTVDDQAPHEVDAKFFTKKGDEEDAEDEEDEEEEGDGGESDGAEGAEKKSNLKKKDSVKVQKVSPKKTVTKLTADDRNTESSKKKTKIIHEEKPASKKVEKKSRHEEPKPTPAMKKRGDPQPTIGMKSRININFKKSETKKTNKLVSTKDKIEESKKDKTTSSKKKETPKQEKDTDDFMTEKGDTAALTKVKAGQKSSTVTKRKTVIRHEVRFRLMTDEETIAPRARPILSSGSYQLTGAYLSTARWLSDQ